VHSYYSGTRNNDIHLLYRYLLPVPLTSFRMFLNKLGNNPRGLLRRLNTRSAARLAGTCSKDAFSTELFPLSSCLLSVIIIFSLPGIPDIYQ
jgi:hypothetical protein